MKERRAVAASTVEREIEELERITAERFKAERHPTATVDGDDRWDYDPFEEVE